MAAPGGALPPDIAAQDKGPAILATCITVTVLSTVFVLGRLFVRAHIMRKMYLDDYFMIAALVGVFSRFNTISALDHLTSLPFFLRSAAGLPSVRLSSLFPPALAATLLPCPTTNCRRRFCGPWWVSAQA